MPARLTILLPDLPARVVSLEEGTEYVLGREPACDVEVEDDRISRRHASFVARRGRWILADLGSKNGVLVDGTPLGGAETALGPKCRLSFGGVPARFETLSEEARRRIQEDELRRFQTSLELQRRLAPARGLDALLDQVLDSVLQLAGADRGAVLLARASGDLEVRTTVGMASEELDAPQFRGSAGAVERVLANGRPLTVSDVRVDAWLGNRPSVVDGAIRAMVCMPLVALGRQIGAIYADSHEVGKTFTELDVSLLEAITSHAAMAITLARLDAELRGLAESLREAPVPRPEIVEQIETVWPYLPGEDV